MKLCRVFFLFGDEKLWYYVYAVFFFQAEDGIRDLTVTGVQTCALPIWPKVIATLGNHATKQLSGKDIGITRVHGQEQQLKVGSLDVLLYPLYHPAAALYTDRKSTRLNSSHSQISYAVFCLKKKKPYQDITWTLTQRASLSELTTRSCRTLAYTEHTPLAASRRSVSRRRCRSLDSSFLLLYS